MSRTDGKTDGWTDNMKWKQYTPPQTVCGGYKNCCNHPQIWTVWFYHRVICLIGPEEKANSVDTDQTALSEAVWSGSTLFAQSPDLSSPTFWSLNLHVPYERRVGAPTYVPHHSYLSNLVVLVTLWTWKLGQGHQISFVTCVNDISMHMLFEHSTWFVRSTLTKGSQNKRPIIVCLTCFQ